MAMGKDEISVMSGTNRHANRFLVPLTRIMVVCLPIVLLFCALWVLAVNVPYWDDYEAIVRYMGWPFSERMHHLLDFHNEHRVVTVRLFLEAMVALVGKVNFKACMLFGSAQLLIVLLCFAWFHLKCFSERIGWLLLIAASWHLFSMLNFDNAFWALTALENFGVIMWAFLSIVLFRFRARTACLVSAWACAVLAVLTSAQGLAVLPTLCLMQIFTSGNGEVVVRGTWRGVLRQTSERLCCITSVVGVICSVTLSSIITAAYFHGFNSSANVTAAADAAIAGRLMYILAFIGNLVPIYPIAIACGCIIAVAVGFIVFRFPKLPSSLHPMFFFMICLMGIAVAGVAFRGANPRAAISFRYYVITACLFICVTALLVATFGERLRMVRIGVLLLVVGFAVLDIAVFIVGWPMFSERNNALRVNILTWPRNLDGLRVGDSIKERASEDLWRLESVGRYGHLSLRRAGEPLPSNAVPWPKPRIEFKW